MKTKLILLTAASVVCAALAGAAALAHDGPEHTAKGKSETVTPNFSHAIPNIPGKSVVAVEVFYPPGAKSSPHTHAKSAFIYAYVVSGSITSQVDNQPARIYKAGESFFESPGAHHGVSGNASETEPAKLLAVFVVDTNDKSLTTPDKP